MKRLMIFDGNSIINRAFYGIRLLSNRKGVYTNAVYGFFNIFFKYVGEEKPDYICVAFDLKAPTFRHLAYDEYKAQRKGMPEELVPQLPLCKDILKAMNVTILEKEGYEADDIIGTVSQWCEDEDIRCEIVTGDKDDLQLASKLTNILLVTTRNGVTDTVCYDDDKVFERYGVTPKEFIDVKAIMGDTSDNIPGIKGIGEKGALALIGEYKSLDYIYENIDSIDVTKSVRQKLIDGKDMAFKSRFLSEIVRNVPLDEKIGDFEYKEYNEAQLYELLKDLELTSLIKRLNVQASAETVEEIKKTYNIEIIRPDGFDELKNVGDEFCYYIDCDMNQIKAFAFLNKDGKSVIYEDDAKQAVLNAKEIFENDNIKKITHNVKDDIVLLNGLGISYKNVSFDTMLAAYILNPASSGYDIEKLALRYAGFDIAPANADVDSNGQMMFLDTTEKKHDDRCANIAFIINVIKKELTDEIEKRGQTQLYYDIELPTAKVLAKMEINGVMVDKVMLREFSDKLERRIEELTESIYSLAGEEFNINSPKQLGVILFEKLGLKSGKKTKTGYSTNAEILENLYDEHPIIGQILEYRQLAKLKSTYCDGLISVINPKTGKIHSTFNQTVTVTGRLSSTEPNLQNIPVRTELGREIRKMFVASDDEHILVDADYSQIELRVLAHMAKDDVMINAFVNGEDIHRITASQVFNVALDEVTDKMRSDAKAVNFGIIYGIGEFSLAKDIGSTRRQAREYIDSYLEKYSKIHQYMINVVKEARESGFAKTEFGRIRDIPELKVSNKITQAFGERVALNMPVQGTAADIMKIAMIAVDREFEKRGLKSEIILQVHDEMIVNALKSESEQVKQIVKEQMENAVTLAVPLIAQVKEGRSWYETK